jgi:hypothetical protein
VITILLSYSDRFRAFKDALVAAQPPHVQQQLNAALEGIMTEAAMETNPLAVETRSKYQAKLYTLRKDIIPFLQNTVM